MKLELADEAATLMLAARLADHLPDGGLVFLRGNLGAGKTTFVRGFLRALGHEGAVKSPTFTLVEEYALERRKIFHFDLYRLQDPEELEWIGMREYLESDAICFIEWPERGDTWLPPADLEIRLETAGTGRTAELSPETEKGRKWLDAIAAPLI